MIGLVRAGVLLASASLGVGLPALTVHAAATAARDAHVTLSVPALL